MSEPKPEAPEPPAEKGTIDRPYEPPRIIWRETYAPVAHGVSCARQPGNPGCNPGPFTS
jgi:hypothetical protein